MNYSQINIVVQIIILFAPLIADDCIKIDSMIARQIESSRQEILNIINTGEKTFKNQFAALDLSYAKFKSSMTVLEILVNLHPDIKIKNRAFSGLAYLQNNFHNIFLENDRLYTSLLDYQAQNKEKLNQEEKYTTIETILELMKHGLHLSISERASITLDNREKDFLTNRFFSNLSNHEDFYNKIVNCKNSDERKKIWETFHNNNSEMLNEDLSQILKLKNSIAKTANFLDSNESELSLKPLNNIQGIKDFLDSIVVAAQKTIYQEIQNLKEINNNEVINPWDLDYLLNKYQQEKYEFIKFENALEKILDLWQKKLNIKITKTKTKLWDQDILSLSVYKDGRLLNNCLIDVCARANELFTNQIQENRLRIVIPKCEYQNNISPGIFFITVDINSNDQLLNLNQAKNLFKNIGHSMLLSTQCIQMPGNILNMQYGIEWQTADCMLEDIFYTQFASRKSSLIQLLLQDICNAYVCLNNDKLSRKNNAIKIYNKIVKEVYTKLGINKILLTDENLKFNYNLHLAITKGASCYTSVWALIKKLTTK